MYMTRYLGLSLCAALLIAGCGGKEKTATGSATGKGSASEPVSKLKITDTVPGEGAPAEKGDSVIVLYRGTLRDGAEFDGNMDEKLEPDTTKRPFIVTLGVSSVIEGWQQGLIGVKTGMVRKLEIPYALAYGENGSGEKIPPKADLNFDIKVLKVLKPRKAGELPEIFAKEVKKGTGGEVKESSEIEITYTGKLLNGFVFDEQEKVKTKVSKLYPGIKESVIGMKAGGTRRVSVPPGGIPTAFTVPQDQECVFEITVNSVK